MLTWRESCTLRSPLIAWWRYKREFEACVHSLPFSAQLAPLSSKKIRVMGCFTLPLAINTVLSLQSAVILRGTVQSEPKSFAYYYMTNDTEIPLVVNPRWKGFPYIHEDLIIINHMVNGKWGNETRIPFPDNFGSPGSSFTMSASISSTDFAVSINDQVVAHFPNDAGAEELKIFQVANVNSPGNQAICAESIEVH